MNKGIHLDLDTWIVPGQILKANLRRVNYYYTYLLNNYSSMYQLGIGRVWKLCVIPSFYYFLFIPV